MSNDEYRTSLVNYSRFYYDQSTIDNNYSSSSKTYQTLSPLKLIGKQSTLPVTTLSFKKSAYQTDDVNSNTNNNKSSNCRKKRVTDSQFVPMNLITSTGLDLSHSIGKPTFETYFNKESLTHNNNNSYVLSPSSSTSSSIDVENYDCADRIMSPVSIPSHIQKPIINDTRNTSQSSFTNMELTAGSIPAGYPLNYQQLYANNAALYGAPVMFSGAIHAAHASYMAGLPLHAALSPNETYLKAIQAAACGIYSTPTLAPPPPTVSTSSSSKPPSLHNPAGPSMMTLAPSTPPVVGISKSPHQKYSTNIVNNLTEMEQHQQQQKKRDYLVTPLNSQTTFRTNTTSNNKGTYLNDKVNERLAGVDATKDSHFKVPNGKEGSLKHRILRPSSNTDGQTEHANKTPVMRSYSTTSSFRKGNYIELANGTLRRVEDMRTEDFIQCAERSPHHQLAESTVVRINTSLPNTAVITFSYDRNRSKVDMEVSSDHPFFVYGQGWASCNPENAMKMFGLKCQRLQVGDICISLTRREQPRQPTPPTSHTTQNNSLPQLNEAMQYQTRHSLAVSSPNAAHLKSPSLPTMTSTAEMPYPVPLNAHSFSIPVAQPSHHIQQSHHHHQVQQQAYAEMAKLMSSYAYTKGLPQLPHEQLKDAAIDASMLQNLPPKMMSAFYQSQIFQLAQQQQQQEHLRQAEIKTNPQIIPSLHYPQPTDLENNHIQQQPPQTQPLDVTMSRKRRWSAPENMFDDDESETQPPRNGLSPSTART